MPRLTLESPTDFFDLDCLLSQDTGVQALSGVTGLGLPPVAGQWLEGAGNGSSFRGKRYLSRDIDIPLLVAGGSRAGLIALTMRLTRMFEGEPVLRFTEDDPMAPSFSCAVRRVGGGSYAYGVDTNGERDLTLVITVRSGDPFFTSSETIRKTIGGGGIPATPRTILPKLAALRVSSSQALGSIDLDNTASSVDCFPVWKVYGPGSDFRAISPFGEALWWKGTLAVSETLTIDSKRGTVIDGNGVNRYALLDSAPRFWTIPPGFTTATASLEGITPGISQVDCTWSPRRGMVI